MQLFPSIRLIRILPAVVAGILGFSPIAKAQDSPVIADGAQLKLISGKFSFTEGPAADAKGNVYFTDQPNNKIWKYSTDGKLSVFMENAGRSNGMYFDRKGNLITCADLHDQLWSISPSKKVTVLVKDFKGHQLNGPNDVWVDSKGGMYFTDPYYQRNYWKRKQPDIKKQRVYYLTPDRHKIIIMADDLVKPNGIIGSPDGKQLYVADIGANKTYVYQIEKNGHLSDKKLFTAMGSDGLTLDSEGNLYLTGKGVTVFNKEGKKIDHIDVKQDWTANVTFGGPHFKTLFITASHGFYKLPMKVKGAGAMRNEK